MNVPAIVAPFLYGRSYNLRHLNSDSDSQSPSSSWLDYATICCSRIDVSLISRKEKVRSTLTDGPVITTCPRFIVRSLTRHSPLCTVQVSRANSLPYIVMLLVKRFRNSANRWRSCRAAIRTIMNNYMRDYKCDVYVVGLIIATVIVTVVVVIAFIVVRIVIIST